MDHLNSLNEEVIKAKNNSSALDMLVDTYRPFIASEVSKILNRYVDQSNDDFMTTGMLAFVEAIRSHDEQKGAFFPFAKLVIRQRIIDDIRKSKPYTLSLDCLDEYPIVVEKSIDLYQMSVEKRERIQVIEAYEQELLKWDIEFMSLVEASPKSEKLKTLYKDMAQYICENEALFNHTRSLKKLPIKELEKQFKINRKKIDRGRIFIIACIVMMNPEYVLLSDYIK